MEVFDGDEINIYGGIQNHSNRQFKGSAMFYVDGEAKSTEKFISKPDQLLEIKGAWKAIEGEHKVQIKITDIILSGETSSTRASSSSLWSVESEEALLKVQKRTATTTLSDITKMAENIVEKIDTASNQLANTIESFKSNPSEGDNTKNSLSKMNKESNVDREVGASEISGSTTSENIKENSEAAVDTENKDFSIKDTSLDLLSYLTRNWKYTLAGGVAILIALKFVIL